MVELIDISISCKKAHGERSKSTYKINGKWPKSKLWTDPKNVNPTPTLKNHMRHSGKIFREAAGGFEIKGKVRFHPDGFEY